MQVWLAVKKPTVMALSDPLYLSISEKYCFEWRGFFGIGSRKYPAITDGVHNYPIIPQRITFHLPAPMPGHYMPRFSASTFGYSPAGKIQYQAQETAAWYCWPLRCC
jgi:hypothetical protein